MKTIFENVCSICSEVFRSSERKVEVDDVLQLLTFLYTTVVDIYTEFHNELEATEDSRICVSCQESVVNFHSVIKLLSKFDKAHISNVESEDESVDIDYKIEIKEEPLMEHSNKSDKNLIVEKEPMQIDIKKESKNDNEINVTYEDFIMKNEEMDIKSECEEGDCTEQMCEVSEEYTTINNSNVASPRFTVDHKNNISSPLGTYIASDVCNYKAKQKRIVTKHMHRNVDEIKMFPCDLCGYKTNRKSSLKIHMLKHKNVDEIEMFKCDICSHTTKHKSGLKRHMMKHKNMDKIKMLICDICKFKTKCKNTLKTHINTHSLI